MLVGSNPEVRSIAKSGDPTVSDIPHDLGCETFEQSTVTTGDLQQVLLGISPQIFN